jgi:predicted RNA-binding protein with PUA-like domain
MAKRYWIMKSEPSEFGIDDLARKGSALWDGVRNYQVRNMFRDEMRAGDKALFYHSSTAEIGVVGEMEVVKTPAADPTQFVPGHKYYDPKSAPDNPRWLGPTVQFVKKFRERVTLDQLRADERFADIAFLRKGNRLSVTQISKQQYDVMVKLAQGKGKSV